MWSDSKILYLKPKCLYSKHFFPFRGNCILAGVILFSEHLWDMETLRIAALKTDLSERCFGGEKTFLFLRGANCTTTSISFIAMWMFLLTAHLCADWAVKILSSCSEWTGSHIQGHYALGVRKIKHQIKADLEPFNCLSWTQRSQPGFFLSWDETISWDLCCDAL